jgi:hypothetical protein
VLHPLRHRSKYRRAYFASILQNLAFEPSAEIVQVSFRRERAACYDAADFWRQSNDAAPREPEIFPPKCVIAEKAENARVDAGAEQFNGIIGETGAVFLNRMQEPYRDIKSPSAQSAA